MRHGEEHGGIFSARCDLQPLLERNAFDESHNSRRLQPSFDRGCSAPLRLCRHQLALLQPPKGQLQCLQPNAKYVHETSATHLHAQVLVVDVLVSALDRVRVSGACRCAAAQQEHGAGHGAGQQAVNQARALPLLKLRDLLANGSDVLWAESLVARAWFTPARFDGWHLSLWGALGCARCLNHGCV